MRSQPHAGAGRRTLFLALAIAPTALMPLACGGSGGPEMARVYGTVTYNGQPVKKGTVSFVATKPGQRNATGMIDQGGNYRLQTENPGDGAELGDYEVSIFSHEEQVLDYKPKTPVKAERVIPEKYEDPKKSGLKQTVKSGSNQFNFELTD
jgi:hypothetical protein